MPLTIQPSPGVASGGTLPGSYISVGDFKSAFTGLNLSMLKDTQIARAILAASRHADSICGQTLYATLDTVTLTENGRADVFAIDLSDGTLKLFPRQFPILQVISIGYSFAAADTPLTLDNSSYRIYERYIEVDSSAAWAWYKNSGMRVLLADVNGWPIGTLAQAVNAGDQAIQIVPPPQIGAVGVEPQLYGFLPGQQLLIQDDANSEVVVVSSTSGLQVNLSAPLSYAHGADVFIAPPKFALAQEATIHLTAERIKSKGVGPLALKNESVEPKREGPRGPGPSEHVTRAQELLADFMVH